MATWLGECIAERELEGGDHSARVPRLRVGKPRPAREGDWECRYEIRGLIPLRRQRVFGVDALQALGLALVAIRADLERLCPWAKWLDEPAHRGLPLQAPMFLPVKFEKRLEVAVRRVQEAFYREMKAKHEGRS